MAFENSARRPTQPSHRERYELVRELARGGMGIVYLAHDELAKREVAYKRLYVEGGASYAVCVALFEREYDTLAQLRHPNIVQAFDYGIDENGPFYTMELLESGDLFKSAPLDVKRACAVLRDVSSALALVHARRLVHRDVTPMNVRFALDGRVRLIDFGALAPFGVARQIVGTPPFVAPECLTGQPLDGRADLFALGALAYWTLTRKGAIGARSLQERISNPNPLILAPSEHVSTIPKELDDLVLSLLHADPLARPSSAAEVMQRLTAIADLPPEPNEKQVAYSYLAHPPLVGRSDELNEARALLASTLAGKANTLLIQGERGSGRSALLDQLAIDARLRGATVLRAQGGASAAFALAQALVQGAASTADAQDEHGPASTLVRSSVRAVAAQDRTGRATAVEMATEHAARVDELSRTLLDASRRAPLVLLIDAVEEADKESLAVLTSLSGTADGSPVLLVLATSEQTPAHGSALGLLSKSAPSLRLRALNGEHLTELVTSLFGDVPNTRRLSSFLNEHCAGNAGTCMRLLRSLLRDDVLTYTTGTFILPYDLHIDESAALEAAVVARALAALSPTATVLIRGLVLQRERMPLELLTTALSLDGGEALASLEELSAAGLVRVSSGHVWSASDEVKHAVLDAMSEPERRVLHLRMGRALLAHGYGSNEHALTVVANLLQGGDEEGGSKLLLRAPSTLVDVSGSLTLFEDLLARRRAAGASDVQCLPLLVPLAMAGYFLSYEKQRQHGEPAFRAMLAYAGFALVNKLQGKIGVRLALLVGLCFGLCRYLLTPRSRRLGSFKEVIGAAVSLGAIMSASSVSAFDAKHSFDTVAQLSWCTAFGPKSIPALSYQFNLATAQMGSGRIAEAARNYERLQDNMERRPAQGISESTFLFFKLGALYGQAQAELSKGSARTLELLDAMRGRHAFYAAPMESTYMAYYASRGDQEQADRHRERAELAALRNGMSWPAISILTVRSMYANMLCRNVMGLMQSVSEFTRLTETIPNAHLYREAGRAYGLLLGGRANEALDIYEVILSDPRHAWLPSGWINRTHRAETLCALGRFADAKTACLAILADSQAYLDGDHRRFLPVQQLALAEAHLGDFASAAARLDDCIRGVGTDDSPLMVGSLHRDRALVAVLARDEPALGHHLAQMAEQFRGTRNPWLIRQCEQLANDAQARGLIVQVARELSDSSDVAVDTGILENVDSAASDTLTVRGKHAADDLPSETEIL